MTFGQKNQTLEIDQYIGSGRYLGFTNICIDISQNGISLSRWKKLLYSSRKQVTCARKHNKPSQDSYLAATLAGAFS